MLKADGSRYTQVELVGATDQTRRAIMRAGTPPKFEDLVGSEFAGMNCGFMPRVLGIRKFVKGFYEGPARSAEGPTPFVQGYNIDVRQNPITEPYVFKTDLDKVKRYGFYRVHRVVSGAKDSVYANSVLLDYGLGGNGVSVTALLRDYLVQVYPDDPTLFLGRAFLAVIGFRIPASFFVLKRLQAHNFKG